MQGIWRNWQDERAVRYVLSGEQELFAALIDRYQQAAWAVASAITRNAADADDVVQEAFIRAYRHLDTLEKPSRFGAWLMSIVRNTALNFRARNRSHLPLEEAPEQALAETMDNSTHHLPRWAFIQLSSVPVAGYQYLLSQLFEDFHFFMAMSISPGCGKIVYSAPTGFSPSGQWATRSSTISLGAVASPTIPAPCRCVPPQ